jgi:hypothetical protein
MKQLDGDHDQRLLGRFALGLGHAEYSKVLSGTLFQSFALTGWVAQVCPRSPEEVKRPGAG